MLLTIDNGDSSFEPPPAGVHLSELSEMTGAGIPKLSALAIAGCFPSSTRGGNRRVVDRHVAEALAVLMPAGMDQRIVLRAFFTNPAAFAEAATEAAQHMASAPGNEA